MTQPVDAASEVRVLVVEDHDATRYAYCKLLKQRGYAVTGVATASEAMEAAATAQPHCILLDLGLPDMEGAVLARRLREVQGTSLVMIAITGIPDQAVHDAAEAAGIDFLFHKPLDIDRLAKILPPIGP